jgi:hypothetical protein
MISMNTPLLFGKLPLQDLICPELVWLDRTFCCRNVFKNPSIFNVNAANSIYFYRMADSVATPATIRDRCTEIIRERK